MLNCVDDKILTCCKICHVYWQQGWCDIPGTVEQVKTKLKMRKEAAIKRDRTMSYSNSTQVMELTKI